MNVKLIDWIPNWHGAWPMVLLPPILGMVMLGPTLTQFFILGAWICGFFATYSAVRAYKLRRRRKLHPPLLLYTALSAVFTALAVVSEPIIAAWALLYVPVFLVWFLALVRGQERSILSRFVSIVGATGMIPVMFSAGALQGEFCRCAAQAWLPLSITLPGWGGMFLVTALLAGYFMGTVPLVKFLVRGRGKPVFFWFATAWHAAFFAFTLWAAWAGWLRFWLPVAWVGLLLRVLAFAWVSRRRPRPIPVRLVGRIEVIVSLIYLVALLF